MQSHPPASRGQSEQSSHHEQVSSGLWHWHDRKALQETGSDINEVLVHTCAVEVRTTKTTWTA